MIKYSLLSRALKYSVKDKPEIQILSGILIMLQIRSFINYNKIYPIHA